MEILNDISTLQGISAKDILEEGLLSGMSVIGEKFKTMRFMFRKC